MFGMIHTLKNIKKKYYYGGAIVVFLLLLILFKNNNEGNITTYTVIKQDVADAITLAGTIDADARVELGFATSGRVSDVFFTEGEKVNQGQVIARIDQNQLQANLIQARASQIVTEVDTGSELVTTQSDLATIRAQQDELVEGAYQNYLSADLQAYLEDGSKRNMVSPIVSGTYFGNQEGEYVLDVYSSSTASGYSFRLSGLGQGTFEALEYQPGQLGSEGLYIQFDPNTNYNNTTWIVPVPNKRSSTYVTRLAAYENALATRTQVITAAQNQLNRVSAGTMDISRSQAQIQQARAQVNAVYAQLNDGRIVAPFDGIIAKNTLEVGQIVSAYQGVVTMFGSDVRELNLNIPEIYINKVAEGDIVEVILDAYPDEVFEGTVETIDIIDTIVDGVPVYTTTVVLNDQDPRIRVGMNAKGRITSEMKEGVIAVPKHFITIKEAGTYVSLQKEGTVTEVAVELGFEGNDGLVEIISGLQEGDVIIRPEI